MSVTTRVGIATSNYQIALTNGSITGFISIDKKPFDSVVVMVTHAPKNWLGQTLTGYTANMSFSGFYIIALTSLNIGTSNIAITDGADFSIRPFLHGYAFSPAEQTVIIQNGRTVGETEFKASKVLTETMPTVTSISPNMASSFSGGTETGTTIVLGGKGFTGVRKVMIGIPYPASPGSSAISVSYTEATAVTINSDNQITVTLPRLDRTKTVSGRTYANCQIYLVRDDASLLAPQRISITYI
ncbi:MAG: IPT/TIG domain-containing protein [Candidatus Kapabacteria bacterium]|nr:IPT/TIG domain-containing protein [Candidatus Kapabacteria bacterium]